MSQNSTPGVNPGRPGFVPHHTEVIARETIAGIVLDILDLTKSQNPLAWELVGQKLDEAADVARVAERELIRRRDVADALQVQACHIVDGSTSLGTQLLKAIIRGGQTR